MTRANRGLIVGMVPYEVDHKTVPQVQHPVSTLPPSPRLATLLRCLPLLAALYRPLNCLLTPGRGKFRKVKEEAIPAVHQNPYLMSMCA